MFSLEPKEYHGHPSIKKKKKKKKKLSFFVVIENLDQIVLKLSLMTGAERKDVVPAGVVLLGRWNLSKISLILV